MDRGPGRQADKLHLQEYHPGQQGPPRSPCLTACFPRKPPRNAQGETKRQREEGKVVGLGIEDGQRERGSLKEGFLGLRHRSGEQGRCMSRSAGRMGLCPQAGSSPHTGPLQALASALLQYIIQHRSQPPRLEDTAKLTVTSRAVLRWLPSGLGAGQLTHSDLRLRR